MGWPQAANPLWLAAGIDRSGERAGELLALGFGGVDFGTVTPAACERFPAATALAARLAPFARRAAPTAARTLVGVNLGIQPGRPLDAARDWMLGIVACAPVADCLTLNLSGETAAPLRAEAAMPQLLRGLRTARRTLDASADASGRDNAAPALAVKAAIDLISTRLAGIVDSAVPDALVCVLDDCGEASLEKLAALVARLAAFGSTAPRLLAVGGISDPGALRAALAAGASAVQIHAAFVERGAAAIGQILDNEDAAPIGDRAPTTSDKGNTLP